MSEFDDKDNPAPSYPKRPREYRKMITEGGNIVELSAKEERNMHRDPIAGWTWVPMPEPRAPRPAKQYVAKQSLTNPKSGAKVLVRGGVLVTLSSGEVVKYEKGTALPKGARYATADERAGWSDPEAAGLVARR